MIVGVVGAGIAGMRAAMLLEQKGHEVRLYEARNRLGGRMETTDHGDGVLYESGGEWIDSDHERVLDLLNELEIGVIQTEGERTYVAHGIACTENDLWSDALEDQLRFEAAVSELCRELRQPGWANAHAAHLDEQMLAALIDEHAHSPHGRWLLTATTLSDEGNDPDQIGLLGWLAFMQLYQQRSGGEMSAFRIDGGAQRLFASMATKIKATPVFDAVLQRVSQHANGIHLTFESGLREDVDAVILTLPPPPLERVVFEPALSPAKRSAIEASRMGPIIKICLEFDHRWWQREGWSGSMQCDLAIQQTWEGGRSDASILTCYICGRAASSFIHHPDPVQRALEDLAQLYPIAKQSFRRGWLHDWISDPFAGGGFSTVPPNFVMEHQRHLAAPEGRIHFAGEYTSMWTGFIEGALESAERAVAAL